MRRPRNTVLVGGSPIRVLRLSPSGAKMLEQWQSGQPVEASPGAQGLADRLLDSGIAHPRPGRADHPSAADVSVVVPVRDRPSGLAETLDTLTGMDVTIVDDGSHPPLRAADLGDASVLRHDAPRGPAAARNTGWRSTATELVAFLDADCRPQARWLDGLLQHFADPSVAAVAPRIFTTARAGTPAWLSEYERRHSPLDLGDRESQVRPGSRVSYVPTAALVVRRRVLEQTGGFDEDLHFGEDVDLVWRIAKMGWRVRYEPSVTVGHPARTNLWAWLQQRFAYGRSAASLAERHGRDVAPLAISPWSAAAWGFAACGHPVAGGLVAAGTAVALARRAGADRSTALALATLAAEGNIKAGPALAGAIRRAWLPPASLATFVAPRRRVRRAMTLSLAAAFVLPPLVEWYSDRPATGLMRWSALRLGDDVAYQAGVWKGVMDGRSTAALLPRW